MAHLHELARCTSEPGKLTRLYLTPGACQAAIRMVRGWMEEAGMTTEVDAAANVVGRYEGTGPDAPALLLGSHIDTVRDAGHYDGNLGVVAAIEAVAALHARRRAPALRDRGDRVRRRGGRALPEQAHGLARRRRHVRAAVAGHRRRSRACISRRRCAASAATRPRSRPSAAAREQVLGYVEVHIEQGPVLEQLKLPVGIVTAIAGASRFRIEVVGEAGHAGTVPMALRKDALAAAAEMILAVERRAAGATRARAWSRPWARSRRRRAPPT